VKDRMAPTKDHPVLKPSTTSFPDTRTRKDIAMKPHRKLTLALVAVAAISLSSLAPAVAGEATAKQKKASDFAAAEKAMQDQSKSSAAGPVPDAVTQATGLNRNKDAGKGAFESEMTLQRQKPSPKVNKEAKAQAPMKSISKMTPEERAELRREVVKEAKP